MSSVGHNLVAVFGIVTYVNVLPLLARVPLGSESFQQYSDVFVRWFPAPSIVSAVAAGPLIVAWSIRKTLRKTFMVSFILTTFLLLFMHHGVDIPAHNTRYNTLDFVVPWLVPVVAAAITSGAMFVVGLAEGASNRRSPTPLVSKEKGVVRPRSRVSSAQPSVMRSVAWGLGVLAGVGVLVGLISEARYHRAQTERKGRFSGDWRGSYTSEFGEGSAQLELKVGMTEEKDVQGTWILEPSVPLGTAGPEVPTWTGRGRLQGVIHGDGSSLSLTLSPGNRNDCFVKVAMAAGVLDGVTLMRGSWRTVNCAAQVNGEIAFSRPAPPDLRLRLGPFVF